jgi:hypothetical protein
MNQFRIAAALSLALSATTVRAADFPEGFRNRFQVELGAAWDSFDTETRLDVTRDGITSVGTTIDFERLLNVPNSE